MFKTLQFPRCTAFLFSISKGRLQPKTVVIPSPRRTLRGRLLDVRRNAMALLALFGLMALGSVNAQTADFVINPSSATIDPGNLITVTVSVLTSTDTDGAEAVILFDPTKLQVTPGGAVELPPFVAIAGPPVVDNVLGTVRYQGIDFPLGPPFQTTDFDLFQIEFEAIAPGISDLTFQNPGTTGFTDITGGGGSIFGTATGATITITGGTFTITTNPGPNGTITPVSPTVNAGDNQLFTITPDPGFEIQDVQIDGGSIGPVPTHEFINVQADATISATFVLADTAPVINLQAAGVVAEEGFLSVPLSITDDDGDNLTVTITSVSNEPDELQNNNGGINVVPYPNSAAGFLAETSVTSGPGTYSSSLEFDPTFGDGASDGDGNGTYTITVQVDDEDGNMISSNLLLTVNDTNQFIIDPGTTLVEAESYDDQGNSGGGDGIGVETGGSNFIIGYTTEGDFAEYGIDVQNAGTYRLDFMASRQPTGSKNMNITSTAGNAVLTVASTGSWGVFAQFSTTIDLNAGAQTLMFDWNDGTGFYMNIDYFEISRVTDTDPPTINPIANVEADEGDLITVPIQVNDVVNPAATIEIFDKSILGTNNPFTPGGTVNPADYTFTDNGGGSYTLNWQTGPGDGRAYEARVTADDGTNPPVVEVFAIDIAQPLVSTILAKTFNNPLPWYGGGPQAPFTVAIESTTAENIGFIDPGEFVEYLVNVPSAGTYDAQFFAGKGNGGVLTVTLSEEDGGGFLPIGSFGAIQGAWQTYDQYDFQVTFTNPGVQTLRLDFSGSGGVNIRDFNFALAPDLGPTIDPIADIEIDEGGTANTTIIVNDDNTPAATMVLYDKSEPLGSNSPYTPALVVTGYTFTENSPGNYTFNFPTAPGDGRSYEARVTADDGVNPPVTEVFKIDVAQDIPDIILARTFANPLPWYGGSPAGPAGGDFSVSIENAGNIGWINNGDFVEYLIDVPTAGDYDLVVTASNGTGTPSQANVSEENGGGFNQIGSFTVNPNGWGSFGDYPLTVTFANSGLQTFRIDFLDGMNITQFEFNVASSNTEPVVTITNPTEDLAAEFGTGFSFTASANDAEEGDLSADIEWSSNLDGPLGTGPTLNTSSLSIGNHVITASVTDNDPTVPKTGTDSFNVIIGVVPPNCDVSFRVNAGGPAYVSTTGDFGEDRSVANAGGTAQTGTPSPYIDITTPGTVDNTFGSTAPLVSNTTGYPDFLFQTERWSDAANPNNMNWAFPTGNGTFDIDILFNENWSGEVSNPRVFDVEIEGVLELDDYRPSGPTGADFNVAKVESFQVTVVDGTLNINFIKGTQNPAVKGFSICVANNPPVVAIVDPLEGANVTRGQDITLTGTANDPEDGLISANLQWTSSDSGFLPTPVSGIGASILGQFVTPGPQTLTASVTDSGGAPDSDQVTVNVSEPSVVIDLPLEGADLTDPNITLDWTGTDVLYALSEHYHIYVNPPDINNIDQSTRISTASAIGQEDWPLGPADGIVNGPNTVVIRIANSSHEEFGDPNFIQDVVNFTVCDVSILEVVASDPTDCGVDDGTISIAAIGSNLEYSIDGGTTFQASGDFTGLAAGPYNIVVRDATVPSCEATDQVTLAAPALPEILSITPTPTSTCGATDGTLVVSATGIDLEYEIVGVAPYQDSNVFNNLAPGLYDVNVREKGTTNCIDSGQGTITDPFAPEITGIVPTDPTDCGLSDGTITINATGSDLLYSIDGGATFSANNVFTGLAAGNYNIVIKENADENCTDADATSLSAPLAPVINSVVTTDMTDCDLFDGTITINANGINIEYSIDDGNTFQDSNAFTGLGSDMYNIVVREKDSPNCEAFDATGINAPFPPILNAPVLVDPTACNGADGSITVNASGINLEYSLDGGTYGPNNVFSGLGAGQYLVSVREVGTLACVANQFYNLFDPPAPVPVITGPSSYLQGTGGVTLDAGAGFASYLWSPGGQTTQMINNALAGTYTVTVIDANGCEGTSAEFVVSEIPDVEPPMAICETEVIQVLLDANGMATLTPGEVDDGSFDNTGFPSLALSQTEFTCADLGDQTVTLIVTDVNGLESTCMANIYVADPIAPTITCPADIVITVPFGSMGTTVTWPDATGSDNCDFVITQEGGPLSGSFFATGTTTQILYQNDDGFSPTFCAFDVTILEGPDTLTITQFWLVNADTNMDIAMINEGDVFYTADLPTDNLNIRVESTPDTESVQMQLTGAQTKSMTENFEPYALYGDSSGNYNANNFALGMYSLSATPFAGNNASGDSGDTRTVNFSFSDQNPLCDGFELVLIDAIDPTTCGGDDGAIFVTVFSEEPPVTFSWSHDAGLNNDDATGLEAGVYTISVTDGNGCFDQITVELVDPDLPSVSLAPFASVLSTDPAFMLTGGSPAGGSYSGPGVSGGNFDPAVAGVGTHTIVYSYTDPSTNCENSASRNIMVNPPFFDAPVIVLDATTDTELFALVDGMTIPKPTIGNTPLGIIYNADLNPGTVGFKLTGPINEQRSEGPSPPFSLFGDIGVDIQGKPFPVGNYVLRVSPKNGTIQFYNFEVTDEDPLCVGFDADISTLIDPTTCGGDEGSAVVSITGGQSPFTIEWSTGQDMDQQVADDLASGNYSVTVTDVNGCTKTLQFTLSDPPLPVVTLAPFADVLITDLAFPLTGGMPMGGTYSGPGVAGGIFTPADAGAGTHTIMYSYTDPSTNCSNSASQTIRVIDPGAQDVVVSFTLVDAIDDTDLFLLLNGTSLPGAVSINIRANTNPSTVGSVKFVLSGAMSRNWTESFAPYALYGDNAGDYFGADLNPGSYTLTATPYSLASGQGIAGVPLTVNFTVTNSGFFNKEAVNPVKVSPNPADRTATLSFAEPSHVTEIYIYDISGKLVKTINADQGGDVDSYLMRVQDLPEATYYLRIRRTVGFDLQQRVVIKR